MKLQNIRAITISTTYANFYSTDNTGKKNDNFFQAFSQAEFASIVEKLTLVKIFIYKYF